MADKEKKDTLSKKDRDALLRITRERFRLLREQVGVRQQEVRVELEKRVQAQYDEIIAEADDKLAELRKEANELDEKIAKFVRDQRKKGIQPQHYYRDRGEGVALPSEYYGTTWTPVDLQEQVKKEFEKLTGQKNYADLGLREQELEITEELLVSTLDGDAAKAFLDKIPTVDTLLPLPEAVEPKALEGTAKAK